MSQPSMKELEDLWAVYEVARGKYTEAVRVASNKAVAACNPQRDEMQKAFNAYHDRSDYLEGKK